MEVEEPQQKIEKKKPIKKIEINSKERIDTKEVTSKPKEQADSSKKTMIYLERTNLLRFDEDSFPDAQLLIGDVVLRHDSAYLYCDTAYFYQSENTFYAFGNVRMEQGDTLSAYSDKLYYFGDNKLAKMRKNVRLLNDGVTLYTDSLNYNRNTNVGYYFNGGVLKDSLNTLKSRRGYYYSDTKMAEFRYNVEVLNEDFILNSDTLKYDTDTKIASILGPTNILYQEETTIYSELGFYNTDNQRSHLKKNSYVSQQGGKVLKGDTIFYDKKAGVGRAYNNVEIKDSTNDVSILGNYGFYLEKGERGLVTDSAVMMEYSSSDTMYVNADTIYSFAQDSDKMVIAYHSVRIFRDDLQAICDSMTFLSTDTVLTLMDIPVLWSDGSQMSGDTIKLHIKEEQLDKIHVIQNAFLAQEEDSVHYNQMSGQEIFCYISDSTISRVDVNGNAESIYYPKDSTTIIGMNAIQSTYMNIFFDDGKIDRLLVYPTPTAKMLQMSKLKKEQMYLANFSWLEYLRPKTKEEIFLRPKVESVLEEREKSKENTQKLDREKREKEREEKRKAAEEKKKQR